MLSKEEPIELKGYERLLNHEISDDELKELFNLPFNFKGEMLDVFRKIGQKLQEDALHKLNQRLLKLEYDKTKDDPNTCLRYNSIAKSLFAIEMHINPVEADKHFQSDEFIKAFPKRSEIYKCKNDIIDPLIDELFYPEKSQEETLKKKQAQELEWLKIRLEDNEITSQVHDEKVQGVKKKYQFLLQGATQSPPNIPSVEQTSPNSIIDFFKKQFKAIKEETNQEQEREYVQALENLQGTLKNYADEDAPQEVKMKQDDVKNKAWKIVTQIQALKESGQESTTVLRDVLKATQSLVTGVKDGNKEIDHVGYQEIALTVQGKPFANSKILGGMMIALGVAVVALSIALAAVINIGAVVGVAGGAYIAAQGIGFFQRGKEQYGLSKAMSNLAKTQEEPWTLIEGDEAPTTMQTDENQSSEDEDRSEEYHRLGIYC